MHKLIVFLVGTIFGFAAKTAIGEVERPSIEEIIAAHRSQSDTLDDDKTGDETEPVGTGSIPRTP